MARPISGLTISGTAAIVDAKLTEDQANSTILITGSTGLRGDEFPNVAKYSGSAAVEYTWPLKGDLNGLLRADYAYVGQSASQFRPTYVYYEKQGDYGYANLRAGVEGLGHGHGALLIVVRQQRDRRSRADERDLGGEQPQAGRQHQPAHGWLPGPQALLKKTDGWASRPPVIPPITVIGFSNTAEWRKRKSHTSIKQ